MSGLPRKQAGFFAHFQTAGHSGFINGTERRFIDKTDPSDPTFLSMSYFYICYASFG